MAKKTKIKSEQFSRFGGTTMPGSSDKVVGESQRFLGAGAPSDLAACCASTLDAIQSGMNDIPRVAEQRSHFTGPVSDSELETLLVPQLKLLNQGQEVLGATTTVETNIDDGELEVPMLIVGVYAEVIPFEYVMTVEGAAWKAPTVAGNQPPVPDVWTKADATTGGSLGIATGDIFNKAYLDVGGWILNFAYQFGEAYNLMWSPGGATVMDIPLSKILKVRGAERGTSPSRRPFAQHVADVNATYRAPETGVATDAIFLPRNATRTGTSLLGGATELSTFEPYDYGDEDVSYDPGCCRHLCGNPEFYSLPCAVAFPRGLNTSLMLRSVDNVALGKAAQALSFTNNTLGSTTNGATPPGVITPDEFVTAANFAGTGASPVFADLSKDAAPAVVPFQTPIGTSIFKIGDFFLSLGFAGWQISDTVYRQMADKQQDVCAYLQSHTAGRCSFMAMAR